MSDFFEFREKMTKRAKTALPDPSPEKAQKALTVSQLTREIDRALRDHLAPSYLVKAEVSNLNHHAGSGHLYFTLKDADLCIDCVMWRSDVARLRFAVEDGMELLARGSVKVYGQRGKYQLYVNSLQPLGKGALELAFQQLRRKLEAEGLFDQERKRPVPALPLRIAIVTGSQAAALHDMLKVLRRFPWLRLFLYSVPVQGDGAGAKIAEALRHLSRRHQQIGGIDLILLGRGGGSLEDLWAFNEEVVARAVAASSIPIITGVGHEVDTSIADLVADYHAHTPTEAAQVATANWRGIVEAIDTSIVRLRRGLRTSVQQARQRLDGAARHEFFRRPLDQVNQLRQLIDDRDRSMRAAMNSGLWNLQRDLREIEQSLAEHSPAVRVRLLRQQVDSASQRISYAAAIDRVRRRAMLDARERELRAVSPESVLRRGYSITMLKKDKSVVRSILQLTGGEKLLTQLSDGVIESTADDPKQPKLF